MTERIAAARSCSRGVRSGNCPSPSRSAFRRMAASSPAPGARGFSGSSESDDEKRGGRRFGRIPFRKELDPLAAETLIVEGGPSGKRVMQMSGSFAVMGRTTAAHNWASRSTSALGFWRAASRHPAMMRPAPMRVACATRSPNNSQPNSDAQANAVYSLDDR